MKQARATRRWPVGTALRGSLAAGYDAAALRDDLLAGLVVGAVALPLSMALAIASGVPPQHGLYTAIIAGGLTALLGGSALQVTGPTAAFVALLLPVTLAHGIGGLLIATILAGALLVCLGLSGLGRLVTFVPSPVTTGFTAGIGLVIATLQIKDFLGLEVGAASAHFLPRMASLAEALPSVQPGDLAFGIGTLALLLAWPRFSSRVPAPVVALSAGAIAAFVLQRVAPEWGPATIASRFAWQLSDGTAGTGIPAVAPAPLLPWNLPGADGAPFELSFGIVRELLPAALTIALLGAIESLLSAVVADGVAGTQHDPDAELVALGIGNLVAPFFGGVPATGALARTATNIRSGARSPFAALFHCLFVLAAMLALAPALGYLPMASLAALLLTVAWRMSEAQHVARMTLRAPRSDVLVLWSCLVLTVLFDMVVAVSVGIVLAALLFLRRMAEVSEVRLIGEHHSHPHLALPGLTIFEVAGPMFFGAAHKALTALQAVGADTRVLLLDLRAVPALDGTALATLESSLARLWHRDVLVFLGGVQRQPMRALLRAGLRNEPGRLVIRRSFERALEESRLLLADASAAEQPSSEGAAVG